jgi:hypothetical protein
MINTKEIVEIMGPWGYEKIEIYQCPICRRTEENDMG